MLTFCCSFRLLIDKELKFGNEGRQALLAGVEILAKAVSATLGPKGRTVRDLSVFAASRDELTSCCISEYRSL